jgi:hypothetical protein
MLKALVYVLYRRQSDCSSQGLSMTRRGFDYSLNQATAGSRGLSKMRYRGFDYSLNQALAGSHSSHKFSLTYTRVQSKIQLN